MLTQYWLGYMTRLLTNHPSIPLAYNCPTYPLAPVGLPDEKGRGQILSIHTAKMRDFNLLAKDVDLKELATETKNYSGAELEGLVRAAQSTAMNRHIKVKSSTEDHSTVTA